MVEETRAPDIAADWSLYDSTDIMTPQRRRATVLLASGMLIDGYDLMSSGAALLFLQRHFRLGAGRTALVPLAGDQAWRWVFGLGALPALMVLVLRQRVPESPRWLVHRGRVEQPKPGSNGHSVMSVGDLFRLPYAARLAATTIVFALIGFSAGLPPLRRRSSSTASGCWALPGRWNRPRWSGLLR